MYIRFNNILKIKLTKNGVRVCIKKQKFSDYFNSNFKKKIILLYNT